MNCLPVCYEVHCSVYMLLEATPLEYHSHSHFLIHLCLTPIDIHSFPPTSFQLPPAPLNPIGSI